MDALFFLNFLPKQSIYIILRVRDRFLHVIKNLPLFQHRFFPFFLVLQINLRFLRRALFVAFTTGVAEFVELGGAASAAGGAAAATKGVLPAAGGAAAATEGVLLAAGGASEGVLLAAGGASEGVLLAAGGASEGGVSASCTSGQELEL
jgi:hypothetical protein